MQKLIRRIMGRLRTPKPQQAPPLDYREFVGGYWDLMGRLQISFLMQQGLRPHHFLLDLACGSLRAGRFFMLYLEPGHYYGLDLNGWLIEDGKAKELSSVILEHKRPSFIVTDRFDVSGVEARFDYIWAQSLFTHLTLGDIALCLRQMKQVATPATRLLATINENKDKECDNPPRSDSRLDFWYGFESIERLGNGVGYDVKYLGKFQVPGLEHPWTDHPTTPTRMIEFVLRG